MTRMGNALKRLGAVVTQDAENSCRIDINGYAYTVMTMNGKYYVSMSLPGIDKNALLELLSTNRKEE